MAGNRALRRLARVQRLEEELAQAAMAIAASEVRRLHELRRVAVERERAGRLLVRTGVLNSGQTDRLAGQEEVRIASLVGAALELHIAAAEKELTKRQEALLAKRVERQQTETLIEAEEERASRDSERSAQQTADSWFLDRRRAGRAGDGRDGNASAAAYKA